MRRNLVVTLNVFLLGMLTLASSISQVKVSATPALGWSKTYGGVNDDYACSVVQTGDGGYAIAGYTNSFGVGKCDFWLVKTDGYGNVQWNKTYGGTGGDGASFVVQTNDGGYAIAGTTMSFGAGSHDFWLVKTDENGEIPEFPPFLMAPLFATLTILAVVLAKKKLEKSPPNLHILSLSDIPF
jgi:hypothetical protein